MAMVEWNVDFLPFSPKAVWMPGIVHRLDDSPDDERLALVVVVVDSGGSFSSTMNPFMHTFRLQYNKLEAPFFLMVFKHLNLSRMHGNHPSPRLTAAIRWTPTRFSQT
jgi:hypothetical protein